MGSITGGNEHGSEQTMSRQKKGFPISATIWVIALVGAFFLVGGQTLKSFDEGNPFTLFGVILTVVFFMLVVITVKGLMNGDGDGSDE